MNSVTHRNINLLSTVDFFSEEFAGIKITLLVDLFSGYNQILFNKYNRDKTVFYIFLDLSDKSYYSKKQ